MEAESDVPARHVAIYWRLVLVVLAVLPGLYALLLVHKHGVNVPYADEFTLAPLLVKAHAGSLSFRDLIEQHNEHRYLLPRLLFIAFARFARGDLRAEMVCSVIFCGFSAIGLWFLLRRTVSGNCAKMLLLSLLINLLIFSPVQAENWCWGFQVCLFLIGLLLVAAILVATSDLKLPVKFVCTAALAAGATFSFGNGLLLWPLTFPLILFRNDLTKRQRVVWITAWIAVSIATIAAYFIDYTKPAGHPSVGASANPVDYYLYITSFLGAHLSRANSIESMVQPVIIGTVLLSIYLGSIAYVIFRRQNSRLLRLTSPWFALGGYALLSACLASVARIGFGVSQSLDSRYTSFSIYLSVALVGLVAIIGHDLRTNVNNLHIAHYLPKVEITLVNAFLIFSLTAYSWGASAMAQIEQTRWRGKASLLLANVLDCGPIYEGALVANEHDARMFANMLDGIGLMRPAMIKSAQVSNLTRFYAEKFQSGYIDQVMNGGARCEAKGWAILPKGGRVADCVVMSYDAPDSGATLFRVADESEDRPDVARLLHNAALIRCGWRSHFDRAILPMGQQRVSAWALDARHASFFQLADAQVIP